MPNGPLKHSLDHFHAEIEADPGIQDALARLNELHVPDPREQRFDDAPAGTNRFYRGLLIALTVAVFGWAGLLWLIANWNW